MYGDAEVATLLSFSGGFTVVASDGVVGVVETPLFPPDDTVPDFLVVRAGRLKPRRPVVAAALVESVDPVDRIVRLRGRREEILRLPEHLPLAI